MPFLGIPIFFFNAFLRDSYPFLNAFFKDSYPF